MSTTEHLVVLGLAAFLVFGVFIIFDETRKMLRRTNRNHDEEDA